MSDEKLNCQFCRKDFKADDVCPHCGAPFIIGGGMAE